MSETTPAKHANLAAALVAASADFDRAHKRRTGQVGGGQKTKYANFGDVLDAVREALITNGLTFVQAPVLTEKNGAAVQTWIVHEAGEKFDAGTTFVPSGKADAHGYGSALTYARRYGLSAALGVATEDDDDGRGAMERPREQPRQQQAPTGTPGPLNADKVKTNAQRLWDVATDKGLAAAETGYHGIKDPAMKAALADTLAAIRDAHKTGEVPA